MTTQKSTKEDLRRSIATTALRQMWLAEAPVILIICAVYERTQKKYGKRSERYVHIETGHAAENLFLQAQSLGLATVIVGAFDDDALASVLRLPVELQPLLLMPVGRD
jgi:SagB-type dehydrogenase family enzyme